jgi:two-component system cell cycle response regulator
MNDQDYERLREKRSSVANCSRQEPDRSSDAARPISREIQHLSDLVARAVRLILEDPELRTALLSLLLTDELTGLYNRRGFLALAEQHLKLARRTGRALLLVYADLDSLKQINDTFGHHEGDLALQATAKILRQSFRDSDIIARFGGDEFTALAIETDSGRAEILTDRLQANLKNYNAKGNHYVLSLSVGVARFLPGSAATIEELMVQADQALYEQKRRRRRPMLTLATRVAN